VSDKAACPADGHGCPACPHPVIGPAVCGSPNVNVNGLPVMRLGDPGIHAACCGPNQWKVAKGSPTVYINGKPLARLGDKTAHCGGSGNLIQGSPNVSADDGAGGALAAVLAKLRALLAGKEQLGKHEAKDLKENGQWDEKNGRGSGGPGKGGAGGEDLSKDQGGANADSGILKVGVDRTIAAPGEKVGFKVELEKAPGTKGKKIAIKVSKKGQDDAVFNTSVTATSDDGDVLDGSFPAPEPAEGEMLELELTATLEGKGPFVCPDTVRVGEPGLYLRLVREPDRETRPARPEGASPQAVDPDAVKKVSLNFGGTWVDFTGGRKVGDSLFFPPPKGRKMKDFGAPASRTFEENRGQVGKAPDAAQSIKVELDPAKTPLHAGEDWWWAAYVAKK